MVSSANKPVLITLGSALVFHVLLLSLQSNHHPGPGFARIWLLDALVPLEKVVDRGVHGVWGVWDGYVGLINVRADNHRLQAENDTLRMELAKQQEAVREAERLRAFVSLAESGIGKTVVARVIGRDPTRSQQTVTIDKGQLQGVRENASVITPAGVVGRVISAGKFSAVVQLITDAQSAIASMVKESRVQAVFKGTGGHELELDYIDNDNDIADGNELVTSGLDQIHPKGLPVAIVTSVGPRRGLFKVVTARPKVDMGRLEEVLVVTELAAQQAEPTQNAPSPLPGD